MNLGNEQTFKSYIDETELEDIALNDLQRTRFLNGETLVIEAQKVLMFAPLSDRKKAILGVLTLTTFKLSFATTNKDDEFNDLYLNNKLLRRNEVCLSNIDTIYQIGDKSKKKLQPGQSLSSKVKELLIVCKNMRVLSFSFKHADRDSGRNVTNALLIHAYPNRHPLLFAYDYKDDQPANQTTSTKSTRFFTNADDWRRELERTKCPNWRITDVNRIFDLCSHFPQHVVVPKDIVDATIEKAAGSFRNGAFPIWVWGTRVAALVRMADLLPSITDRTQENFFVAKVHRAHPDMREPKIIELGRECPSAKEVQASYLKLRNLCIPDSIRLFKAQEIKFYSLLEHSKWMQYVSTCLNKANEAAELLMNGTTVVLQEDGGQDLNCIISSLIQLLCDSYWRTRDGFQSLIQKEWIALGHPFANRLGHIINADTEQSYIFLLFLDCVWQLLQQFPAAFQFTETYLTTIWDSAHVTIFDTFLFNCQHDRHSAMSGTFTPRSVWEWERQFAADDLVLFNNPLYDATKCRQRLVVKWSVSALDLWRQCYFRWLPELEIRAGGRVQIDVFNRFLAEEVALLRYRLQHCDVNGVSYRKTKETSGAKVNSFYPFSLNREPMIGCCLQVNNELLSADALETQSIINFAND